jgi:D-arginine dehydrogenase
VTRPRVAVVGGGIAGVSIAYELSAEADVVLLEQEGQLAYHTTGRSAAMYLQTYGNAVVRALTVASRPDFDRIQREFDTPPLLTPVQLLWIADEPSRPHLAELLESAPPMREITTKSALEMCPALRPERLAAAGLDTSAMEIDVPSLHQAYVRGLLARKGEVRRSAPLLEIDRDIDGLRALTPDGWLKADFIVNAAGAWADRIAVMAGVESVGLRPLRRTIFTSPVSWPTPIDSWPFISDAGERFYFKAEHDQVLVSPADEVPDEPRDVKPEEADIAKTLEIVNEYTTLQLKSVRAAWAGLRSFVADRSPVVGSRPGEDGFFWFAAQGGYGIQMGPALARAGASLLLHDSLPEDIAALGVKTGSLLPMR